VLTREENEYLCRVGPGTPMGSLFRRYWMPAVIASRLPAPDCPPVAFRLLGERLVAFRDSEGHVGVLDELCCHRGASLALGRVEDCGIRCLYHGWKFGADGTIQETPNLPDSRFKERVRAPAYPVREAAGLIWVYLGPTEKQPPFPTYSWMDEGAPVRAVELVFDWNWAQVMEGLLDSSHVGVLHVDEIGAVTDGEYRDTKTGRDGYPTRDNAPKIEVRNTDFGFHYAALRQPTEGGDDDCYVRITPFIMPSMCYIPPSGPGALIVVPRDDSLTSQIAVGVTGPTTNSQSTARLLGMGFVGPDGRVQLPPQDREAMARGDSFCGVPGIPVQDALVQGSMGAIFDRSKEHLVPADLAVIRMRRLLIESARRVEAGGDPVGLDRDVGTKEIACFSGLMARSTPWRQMVPGNVEIDSASAGAEPVLT